MTIDHNRAGMDFNLPDFAGCQPVWKQEKGAPFCQCIGHLFADLFWSQAIDVMNAQL